MLQLKFSMIALVSKTNTVFKFLIKITSLQNFVLVSYTFILNVKDKIEQCQNEAREFSHSYQSNPT